MTNSEHFEKNKISFAEAMEIFNKQKDKGIGFFDTFLASEHVEPKFKVGDIIVLQLNEETRDDNWKHNVVFEIIEISDFKYRVKYLTPSAARKIGEQRPFLISYADRNCILY